jgi:hypothetical protein
LEFQAFRKIRDLALEKGWLRNDTDEEDDPYKTLALVYNREMDQLVVAIIVNNEMEKENILRPNDKEESKGLKITHPRDTTIDSNEEEEKPMTPRLVMDKEAKEPTTLRSKMGSNHVNNTPKEIGCVHFVRHKGPRNN